MNIMLKSDRRSEFGKNAARRIRREGNIPAILYGLKTDNIALTLNKKDIFKILKSETGENTLFKIKLDKEQRDVMIKEVQQDVVSDEVQHIDLIQIALDKAIRVMVPVVLTGDAVGVKAEGGFVDFSTRELEVECLPSDIPEHIDVDISDLHLHQSYKVEDLPEREGVTYTMEENTVIAMIQASAAEEEFVEDVEEEEEEIMGEGEQPEVIKKEKTEEEQE